MIKILNIVGARPNFMKMAPLVHEMAKHADISARLIHTGQHYDQNLSDVFFDELGIPRPDESLGVGSLPREAQIARIEELFEPVLVREQPNLVIVVGDVNSTVACTRVAKRHGVKVAHVEAGLRSFDWDMPEEHNRVETDMLSDYLFTTEADAETHLKQEKCPGKAFFVGNCMIDTLIANLPEARARKSADKYALPPKGYLVATFHRPSNVDTIESLQGLLQTVRVICERLPLVLPLHPRTKHSLEQKGLWAEFAGIAGLTIAEPLGYLDFIGLVENAAGVVTDSGGIQEETTYLQVPCLTMRENTERPITIDLGSNQLIGANHQKLAAALDLIAAGKGKQGQVPPLWDGHTAARIIEILKRELQ